MLKIAGFFADYSIGNVALSEGAILNGCAFWYFMAGNVFVLRTPDAGRLGPHGVCEIKIARLRRIFDGGLIRATQQKLLRRVASPPCQLDYPVCSKVLLGTDKKCATQLISASMCPSRTGDSSITGQLLGSISNR